MKRDPGLADLSRDHHQALFQAMRMKRATDGDLDEVREDVLDLGGLRELGERLEDHVRHEERVLFPMVETALQPAALAALGERLAEAERPTHTSRRAPGKEP